MAPAACREPSLRCREIPLLSRARFPRRCCTGETALLPLQPVLHQRQGLCEALRGRAGSRGRTPTLGEPWQGGNLPPTSKSGEDEAERSLLRANPALNPQWQAGLAVTTRTPLRFTSSAVSGLEEATPSLPDMQGMDMKILVASAHLLSQQNKEPGGVSTSPRSPERNWDFNLRGWKSTE